MATYVLTIEVVRRLHAHIGRLGAVTLERGRYWYVGSARRAAAQRIARHVRKDKTCRWHIDYILSTSAARVSSVRTGPDGGECAVAQALRERFNAQLVLRGMGSSDCRCSAHFFRAPDDPEPAYAFLREKGYRKWKHE
jgi:Uri superfamily endonuclease